MIDKNFWKNSKVLVTGHSGFKGFWLCNYLKLLQSKVYGISLEKNKELNYKNIIENFPDAELIDVKLRKDEGQND